MEENTYPNMDALCRLCMREDVEEAVKIYPKASDSSGTNISIPMRIMACAALEVQASDGLPKSICTDCRYQLEKSYYFRKRSQASDRKLRKHIKLIGMGKKSNVFAKTEDEDFEFEMEDSVRFLKEHKDEWKEKEMEKMHDQMQAYRNMVNKTCKEELREEVQETVREELRDSVVDEVRAELRGEVRQEVKEELCEEVKEEVRELLQAECREQAKLELRAEMQEECRQEELAGLVTELESYLREKKHKVGTTAESSEDMKKNEETETKHAELKNYKLSNSLKRRSQSLIVRKVQKAKLDEKPQTQPPHSCPSSEENEDAIALDNQSLPFDVISEASNGAADEEEAENEQDFYILDSEDGNDPQENANTDGYFSSRKFNLEASGSTSYQIEEDGEIQYIERKLNGIAERDEINEENDDNVMVFNFAQDEENLDIEFENMEKQVILMKSHTEAAAFVKNVRSNSSSTASTSASALEPSTSRTTDTPKTFKCDSCPMLFSTETSMNRHHRTHIRMRQKGVSFQCPKCHIYVSCKSALTRHMMIHTGQRPYVCEECNKSFVQREILKRHMQTHTGERPHKCHHCDCTFTQKVNLTQHINKHHTEVPKLLQHKCHLCTKRFNHASGLSRHLASHSGVAFQCTECERTFGDRSSVKRHITKVHMKGDVEAASKSESEIKVQKVDTNFVEIAIQ